MNNYEYIIASLPVLDLQHKEDVGVENVLAQIREQLDAKDLAIFDFLMDSEKEENLTEEYYSKALKSPNRFIRDYFLLDLVLRNAKVEYLNFQLGRPEGKDILEIEHPETDYKGEIEVILNGNDLLEREKGLDTFVWDRVDDMTVTDIFDLNLILAFAVKLKIVNRWLKLDPEKGRELFRRLATELIETYKI